MADRDSLTRNLESIYGRAALEARDPGYGLGGDFAKTAAEIETALDGRACLDYLMAQPMPSRDQARAGAVFASAVQGDLGAKIALAHGNILFDPEGWTGYVAFPDSSALLDRLFAFTHWAVDWSEPLARLDGAERVRLLAFSGRRKKGVSVPVRHVATASGAGGT